MLEMECLKREQKRTKGLFKKSLKEDFNLF